MIIDVKDNLRNVLNYFFCRIENILLSREMDIKYPVIIIIGPPRTGSTLLYQLIARKFQVCYFSNVMMGFPCAPGVVSRILSFFNGCTPPDAFNSEYGEISGRNAPSQGYKAWNRWFPEDQRYIGKNVIGDKIKKEIHNTVALIQNSFNLPFVNKWQGHSARIFPLAESLPNILFLRIRREMDMTAQSILSARRKFLGDEKKWMSTKPKEFENIKSKSPIDQVCEQVFYLEKNIDEDIASIGADRCLSIEYADLCIDPCNIMNKINKFIYKKTNYLLKERFSIPNSFKYDDKIEVSDLEFKLIKEKINALAT